MDQLFSQLGLTKKERGAYLKLLELGAQPISILAKHSSLPRSSMYVLVDRLKQSGLIEEFQRAGIKYIKCIPVEEIKNLLKLKEEALKTTQALLLENLPSLKKLENRSTIVPKIKIYEGKEEVKKIYEEVLKEESFQAYFNPDAVLKHLPKYYLGIAESIKKNKNKAQEIVTHSQKGLEYKKLFNSTNHKIKILKKGITFDTDTIITKEKVFMILYDDQEISGIEIWSKALSKTQSTTFQYMWDNS